MSDDEAERLNQTAFLAARGLHENPTKAIADLLRSGYDIDPLLRTLLADMVEGTPRLGGPIFTMSGHATEYKLIDGLRARQEKLKVGRLLRGLMSQGHSRDYVIEQKNVEGLLRAEIGKLRGLSRSKLDKAISYADRVDAWVEQHLGSERYQIFTSNSDARQFLEHRFHAYDYFGRDPEEAEESLIWTKPE